MIHYDVEGLSSSWPEFFPCKVCEWGFRNLTEGCCSSAVEHFTVLYVTRNNKCKASLCFMILFAANKRIHSFFWEYFLPRMLPPFPLFPRFGVAFPCEGNLSSNLISEAIFRWSCTNLHFLTCKAVDYIRVSVSWHANWWLFLRKMFSGWMLWHTERTWDNSWPTLKVAAISGGGEILVDMRLSQELRF